MSYQFKAAGRDWDVEEARVGQVIALRRFLASIPRPPAPSLNLEGLMDALTRGATEVLPESFAEKLDRQQIDTHLREIRRSGRMVIAEHLAKVREEERYWPPDPQHPLGIHLLLNSDGGPEELMYQILRTTDPGILRKEVSEILEPDDPKEGIAQADLDRALAEFFGINRMIAEASEAREESDRPGGPAKSEKKADPKADRPDKGRAGRSRTKTSTPSS